MSKRPHISLRTKLAAALLTIVRPDEHGRLVRVISHSDARKMTADQIISLYNFDHWPVRFADGGPCEPWNLEPRPIIEHRTKTAKKDAPEMKKARRIAKRRAAEVSRVDVRGGRDVEGCRSGCNMQRCAYSQDGRCARLAPAKKSRWPKRPFPGSKADKAARAQRNTR
jgi:hypothetical protein